MEAKKKTVREWLLPLAAATRRIRVSVGYMSESCRRDQADTSLERLPIGRKVALAEPPPIGKPD